MWRVNCICYVIMHLKILLETWKYVHMHIHGRKHLRRTCQQSGRRKYLCFIFKTILLHRDCQTCMLVICLNSKRHTSFFPCHFAGNTSRNKGRPAWVKVKETELGDLDSNPSSVKTSPRNIGWITLASFLFVSLTK